MTRSALRRTAASFLFLLLSLTTLAAAAPQPVAGRPKAGMIKNHPILAFFWNHLIGRWAKEGPSLDPDGKPLTNPATHEGSSLDPSGVLSDNGSSLDPNGVK
jgi:hypothetical protein